MEQQSDIQDLRATPVPPGFPGRGRVFVQLWYIVQATLFGASPHALFGWRNFLLKAFGARIGRGVKVRPSARVTYPWNVTIGEYSYIGDEAILYSLGRIEIGRQVSVSYRTFLCTGTHDHTDPRFPLVIGPIIVESESWLAADVFVAPGVRIGRGAVVGARSSVFCDVPALEVWAGNPATKRGCRGFDTAATGAQGA